MALLPFAELWQLRLDKTTLKSLIGFKANSQRNYLPGEFPWLCLLKICCGIRNTILINSNWLRTKWLHCLKQLYDFIYRELQAYCHFSQIKRRWILVLIMIFNFLTLSERSSDATVYETGHISLFCRLCKTTSNQLL